MERMIPASIEPRLVLQLFEEISRIPRGTGNEQGISDWLVHFAKEHHLFCTQDKKLNVLIRKPGTPGHEDRPGVILQSHMDMVCEKTPDSTHDFLKDPIQIVVEGDMITAKETTLGGDDGIGMALSLALLAADDIEHPPLEALFTVDEELGQTGAEEFDASQLRGEILINLDSDDDGLFVVGSAGGPTISADIPIRWAEKTPEYLPFRLRVSGLLGGHSGEDIHRERGNANKLLFRLLDALERESSFELASINGGQACNAIPRDAEAILLIPQQAKDALLAVTDEYCKLYQTEYRISDPGVYAALEPYSGEIRQVFSAKTADDIINFGLFCETGILRMSTELEGVVESSNSLGIIATDEHQVTFTFVTRSFLESMYRGMVHKIDRMARSAGGASRKEYDCLEWPYKADSRIRSLFVAVYEELFQRKSRSVALHGGLECGIIGKNIGRPIDMISMGPECKDLHKPGEWLSIDSTDRYWNMLKEVLHRI